jgi:hypothetical protein
MSLDLSLKTLLGGRYMTADGDYIVIGYFANESVDCQCSWVEEVRELTVKEALDAFKQQSMQQILDTPIGNKQVLAADKNRNRRKRTKKRVRKSKGTKQSAG